MQAGKALHHTFDAGSSLMKERKTPKRGFRGMGDVHPTPHSAAGLADSTWKSTLSITGLTANSELLCTAENPSKAFLVPYV